MELLRLAALDLDDLAVISTHMQDAVLPLHDLAYLASEKRFVLVARRFDWTASHNEKRRRLSGLHFERVLAVRFKNIDFNYQDQVLNLLAMTFHQGLAPSGTIILHFSNDAAIQLDVECIEASFKDLGPVWETESKPQHDEKAL